MYLTILNYDGLRGNEVITFELPNYCANFQNEDYEEYISHTLGFNVNSIDWQTHEGLPELVELHNQEYA